MLSTLSIRDVVLIERLDLAVGPGLTALTGETGAGKSIVLDALGLATGERAGAGLVRRGAAQASATAVFNPDPAHPAWALLAERGLDADPVEGLILRRQLSADGRSRAFVNDQAVGVGVLRELGALLLEVHGQHQTVGLLDPRTHRALLDGYGGVAAPVRACAEAWAVLKSARAAVEALQARHQQAGDEAELLATRLAELDRLHPRSGEEQALAEERALLGAAEKAVADVAVARDALGGEQATARLSQAVRAVERARERALTAGANPDGPATVRLAAASAALERALIETLEAVDALESAAQAFDFEPDRLERTEERLFALRAVARRLHVAVDDLPAERVRTAEALRGIESAEADLAAAQADATSAEAAYAQAAATLTAARSAAGERLAEAVGAELKPLKLDRARFRVALESLPLERAGAGGSDRVEFEVSTNPGAPFGRLGEIASGGELARFALVLKVAAGRGGEGAAGPVMIFDEVDQGVGGAVADAVGLRLKRLAQLGQVLVVTHSPQVAARADAHWRVSKSGDAEQVRTAVEVLAEPAREDEIARMLSGAEVTPAARAAARALIQA